LGEAVQGCHDPTVLGLEHTRGDEPIILAANHTSPIDVPLLILHVPRKLDFVSSTEVFAIPGVGRFYRAMNAFPLDRSRPDSGTVRVILDRLKAGRTIAMFPEGGFRLQDRSVLHGGAIRPGIGRIARIAQTPVVPCAIEDSLSYMRAGAWLPLRRTRYGVAFGSPMAPPPRDADEAATRGFEARLTDQIRRLHRDLLDTMQRPEAQAATRRHQRRRK